MAEDIRKGKEMRDIKEAVGEEDSGDSEAPSPGENYREGSEEFPVPTEYSAGNRGTEGMQPSMLVKGDQYQDGKEIPTEYSAAPSSGQDQGSYPQGMETSQVGGPGDAYAQDVYQQYQPYQEAMSSDVITEISEQVVSEKLSAMQDKLEKALDFRTIAETKISSLNERLRRIEQILDRLQLSILQKVGDYVNDVKDIKNELIETQRTFGKVVPGMKRVPKEGSGKGRSKGVVP
jgi:hypothetical protein